MQTLYVGRFAPSPSGPLHFGSLVCALASYLDAKLNNGQWLLRIDDIDPAREPKGAADSILSTLHAHNLHWDGDVFYQSHQSQRYHALLDQLYDEGLSYRCQCNRKRLAGLNFKYDSLCKRYPPNSDTPSAIRLDLSACIQQKPKLSLLEEYIDAEQGIQQESLNEYGDFVIHRKDGLFAYQLTVVADEIEQSITHVVRGVDLLTPTARQRFMMKLLGHSPPEYQHIPVVVNESGNKLSKQNHALALSNNCVSDNLWLACRALELSPTQDQRSLDPTEILHWAIPRWGERQARLRLSSQPAQTEIAIPKLPSL